MAFPSTPEGGFLPYSTGLFSRRRINSTSRAPQRLCHSVSYDSDLSNMVWISRPGSERCTLHWMLQLKSVLLYFMSAISIIRVISFFLRFYFFLERGEGREKERERNIHVWEIHQSVAPRTHLTGDLAHNPGLCPDWESNQWSFSSKAGQHLIHWATPDRATVIISY